MIQKRLPFVTLSNAFVTFLLMLLVLLGTYINSFPAYTLLPLDEVEPVNMKCRHRTKEVLHQNQHVSKMELHRTICTFNVFHYDLRNRNKTYFVLDIDIDIAKIRHRSNIGKLFTIKLFHLNETYNTYHMQRSKYWSVSWCKNPKDELAMCLDVNDYRKETIVEQNTIGRMGENKRVSFLFVVDNNREVMEIFSTEVLLKDDIPLKRYYKEQILSVWISLTDPKNDKHLSARIRSGGNITIGDLPNPSIVTHYETVTGLITYPFRYFVNLYTMFLVWSKDK
ncbi:uncharacterized protein LOC117314692 [Pecten maximus]|uniref:uncharacterized protein LOC117314692 n=1 Tax=Pecten maximus TaxID=6579 RepID=UPI0014591A91|nr:uncharacterized protein LOC117314692 [Pecten maximus]